MHVDANQFQAGKRASAGLLTRMLRVLFGIASSDGSVIINYNESGIDLCVDKKQLLPTSGSGLSTDGNDNLIIALNPVSFSTGYIKSWTTESVEPEPPYYYTYRYVITPATLTITQAANGQISASEVDGTPWYIYA